MSDDHYGVRVPHGTCPHCKSDNLDAQPGRFDEDRDKTQIVCLECGTSGPCHDYETVAWALWDDLPRAEQSVTA